MSPCCEFSLRAWVSLSERPEGYTLCICVMCALHTLYMCVYTYIWMCMCIYHKKPKELDPLELESKVFVRCGCWELNLDPLEEQYSHLTSELSLLPHALESWDLDACLMPLLHEGWLKNYGAWHEIHGSCQLEVILLCQPGAHHRARQSGVLIPVLTYGIICYESLLKVSPDAVFSPEIEFWLVPS